MTEHYSGETDHNAANAQRTFTMRPIELSDSGVIADWYQHIEDISIFDRHVPLPINRVDVEALVKTLINNQENDKCRWFIAETAEGTAVGMSGLESINLLHGHTLLPMFIAEPWRRSGVGIRMACMMIDLAFNQLRLNKVATLFRADNAASERLLMRLGFTREGIAREAWFSHGRYFDLINVGLLATEWLSVRAQLQTELSSAISVELGPRPSSTWRWPATD